MIGYFITSEGIATSDGRTRVEPPYLDWLLEEPPGPKMFYDLDASVAALLRLLNLERHKCEKLAKYEKLTLAPYKLTYYPSKFLGVDKGYGPGHPFINLSNSGTYADTHFSNDTSMKYALDKAREAKETLDGVAAAFKSLGLSSDSYISPMGAFERSYMNGINPPTLDDLPLEASELAYDGVKGIWIEARCLGRIPNAVDFDLSSAYSSELAEVYDTRRGTWLHDTACPNDAVYGFARGTIDIQAPLHPFIFQDDSGSSYTPTGRWETTLTKQEIDFLYKHKLGTFEDIQDGWWWVPDPHKPQFQPWKGVARWLWHKRQTSNGCEKTIAKKLSVGIWGKCLESRGAVGNETFGPQFNSVVGCLTETGVRLKVAEALLTGAVNPSFIAVDGFVSSKQPSLELSEGMGGWRLSHKGDCVIVSSGAVALAGKTAPEEFSLSFDWLLDQINHDPRASEYSMSRVSVVSLGRALNTSFEKLGLPETITRAVRIGEDKKRLWKKVPQCGADLLSRTYNSEPWSVSVLKRISG